MKQKLINAESEEFLRDDYATAEYAEFESLLTEAAILNSLHWARPEVKFAINPIFIASHAELRTEEELRIQYGEFVLKKAPSSG